MTRKPMDERVKESLEKHRGLLPGATVDAVLFNFNNDLGVSADWGDGVRHGARSYNIIPPGGLSDEALDWLMRQSLKALRGWRERHAS
jgi:hypothetical protein